MSAFKRFYLLVFLCLSFCAIFNIYYEKDYTPSTSNFFQYLSNYEPIDLTWDDLNELANEPLETIDEISLNIKDKMNIPSFLAYFLGFFAWLGQYLIRLFHALTSGVSFLASVIDFVVYVVKFLFLS